METLYSVQLHDLKRSDRSQDVKVLQALLNAYGYEAGKADGIYGIRTLDALLKWKKKVGLEQNDKVTMSVWDKLFNFGGN